jgi:predicted PurR-regulated permease PerM
MSEIEAVHGYHDEDEAKRRHMAQSQLAHTTPDARTVALLVLSVLAVFYTLYLASDIVVPFVLAIVLNLLLQPARRFLSERLRLPAPLASLVLILALFGVIGGIGTAISVPASGWIARAPQSLPTLQEKLSALRRPIEYVQEGMRKIDELMRQQEPGRNQNQDQNQHQQTVNVQQPSNVGSVGLSVLSGTRAFVGQLFTLLVVLFFLLSSGDSLLRRFVEILPRFDEKKRVVRITEEIERNVSGYLATITVMNALVGIASGLNAWACGLPDPLLWGTVAFLLNYIPILGPFCGVVIFFFVGLFTYSSFWSAFIPAGVYLTIHVIEGETVTPMLVAHRFTLNPVLVIVSLFFWDWMWGVIGALLAVPLLAVAKIVCDRIPALVPLGHLIGGSPQRGVPPTA